jgi:hypothetical protein
VLGSDFQCDTPECDNLGSFLLIKLVEELFGTLQKRLDSFGDLAEHFVLKVMLRGIRY